MRAVIIGLAMLALITSGEASAPARPMTSCTPGPYIVFFDLNDAHLNPESRGILDNSISNLDNCGAGRTFLKGHTDASEPASLARKRVDVVREYLTAHGTPRGDITVSAVGAREPRVRTGPGVQERQNRRVELTFGPPT